MSCHRTAILRRVFASTLLGAVLATSTLVQAGPDDEKKGRSGSSYRNAAFGIRARGPAGWKMVADRAGQPTQWKRLVTFNDAATDAQATLSVRPRAAATLDDLLNKVRADWAKTPELRVSSMRKIETNALNDTAQVIVDAAFARKARRAAPKKGVPAPPRPDVTYRVQAVYYLGAGHTYLLYAQGQETHWSRLRGALEQLRTSVRLENQADGGPKGEGSYRNEVVGFTCRYPKGYTVVSPQRENHVIQFEGVAATDPVLAVYAFKFEQDAARDAQRLVAYYEEDKGGTASAKTIEVSGRQGALVTAKAVIGGVEKLVLIAVMKRDQDCIRLRASMPVEAEALGTAVFSRFMADFRLGSAPR